MRIVASIAGWAIFFFAMFGLLSRNGDDPITAALVSAGLYRPVVVVMSIVLVLALIYTVLEVRSTVGLHRLLLTVAQRLSPKISKVTASVRPD